jgi:hypothetical protein
MNKNRCPLALKSLLSGLAAAQALATLQVYLSNAELYRKLVSIKAAGYMVMPNQQVMNGLRELGPAFFGGLFFTFTAGAGIAIVSLALVWTWDRIFLRSKFVLVFISLVWAGVLWLVNSQSFCPMVTSYFIVIPAVVIAVALKSMPSQRDKNIWLDGIVQFAPIILLALLWTSQLDSRLFSNLRDHFLLSNTLGTKINDFYYKYTLYPAEALKTLEQKVLKTCYLEHIKKEHTKELLKEELVKHDYLCIGNNVKVDLLIEENNNNLVFKNPSKIILKTTLKEFLFIPHKILHEFSSKSDGNHFFRQFTLMSLLMGFPIALYIALYSLIYVISRFFLGSTMSSVLASILCLLAGIASLAHFQFSKVENIDFKDLAAALQSESRQKRVAALKIIDRKGIEIAGFRAYEKIIQSPFVAERYWLAKALGSSRKPETVKQLLSFLDDPHINVVCMALDSLSRRGNTKAVQKIMNVLETSNHWYEQWYAYKALRKLGWNQTGSK